MIFKIDESQPSDSLYSHWSEVHYDGEPDSTVPAVPLHWHRLHDEHMLVTKGRAEFTDNGKKIVANACDDLITIPRMHTHSIKCFKGEATIFKEYTRHAMAGWIGVERHNR